jgi:PAS domain S-box-containing protein
VLIAPIRDEQNGLKGFVGLPLDLKLYAPSIEGTQLAPAVRMGIVSADGHLVWRNEDQENLVGKYVGDIPIVKTTLETKDGNYEGMGTDGIHRFYAVAPIPEVGWYAFVGMPSAPLYGQAVSDARLTVFYGVLGLLASLALALFLARRIAMPISGVSEAARAIKDGNKTVRAPLRGPREVVEVASDFNTMVDTWMASLEERRRAEEVLHRLNRELRAISDCNQTLMRAVDEQTLLNEICRIVCDEAGYRMAWVGFAEKDDARTIRPVAWAGFEDRYLQQAHITWADTDRGRGPSGRAIRSGESVCIQDFALDPLADPWRDSAVQRGYRSSIALPLKDDSSGTFGTLNIYSTEPNSFTVDEIRLLEELAGDLAFGILVQRARIEREQAERALRESERRLDEAQRIAHIGYWDRDLDSENIRLSDEACRIFGLPALEGPINLERWQEQWLQLLHQDDRARAAQALADALRSGPRYDVEYRVQRPDGEVRVVHSFAEVTRDESGRPRRVFGTMQDITERKKSEQEIQRLNQELEQRVAERTAQLETANRELEAFTYSVSHDLRAPLRHIDGFVGLLKKRIGSTLDEQSLRYMATVSAAALRMAALIDDLLSFSRMGRKEITRTHVDLDALIHEVIQDFEPDTQGRTIDWRIAKLPVVTGDRAMLRVVLVNLISNALKFTQPRAQAVIEVGCLPSENGGAVVFVRDNGVGFDMQYAGKLFGVFQRLHGADEFEGTGIGLANVQRVISRHGGQAWAEGKLDGGATFYFSLP